MPYIGMIIGKFACLISNCLGDFLTAIADIHAVKPSERVEQFIALAVFYVTTAGGADYAGCSLATGVLTQMGRGVKEVLSVPLGKLVIM